MDIEDQVRAHLSEATAVVVAAEDCSPASVPFEGTELIAEERLHTPSNLPKRFLPASHVSGDHFDSWNFG